MALRRKKLLYTGLTTLLILLAANGAAGLLRIKYWRPGDERWQFNLYVYQRARLQSDVLFLGSSITRYDVVSRALERQLADDATEASVFNLGHAASTSLESAIILRDLIASNGCPEMVALEVSAAGLNASIDQTAFISDYASFDDLPLLAPDLLSLAGADAFLASRLGGLVSFYYHTTKPPTGRAVKSILRRAGSRWHPQRHPRRRKHDKRMDRSRLDAELWPVLQFRLTHFLHDFEVGGASARGLEAVVRMASECESRLLLLRFPTLLVGDTEELTRIESEFEDYIQAVSWRNGLPIYEIDPDSVGLAPEHYRDFVHLNHAGAMRFTAFLAEEVIGPELRAVRLPRS